MKLKLWVLVVLGLIMICSFTPEPTFCKKTGLKGHVYLVTGNQMPSPDNPPAVPRGMKTTLYIYELTNINQVSRQGNSAFYTSINTKLVKEVQTDDQGAYKIKLKPGKYSLFVKKGSVFYSSQFDDKNNIHPVEITSRQMTENNFQANYDAFY